jgi:hypothetical protein
LAERDELRGRLGAYAAKAATLLAAPDGGLGPDGATDLSQLEARARELLDHEPADLNRARALIAAYQAYLGTARGPAHREARPTPGATP